MRLLVIFALLFAAAGCRADNDAQKSERELAIIKANHGSAREICGATKRISAAYLRMENSEGYQRAKLEEYLACSSADAEGAR